MKFSGKTSAVEGVNMTFIKPRREPSAASNGLSVTSASPVKIFWSSQSVSEQWFKESAGPRAASSVRDLLARASGAYSIRVNPLRIVGGLFHRILRRSKRGPPAREGSLVGFRTHDGPLARSREGIVDCTSNKRSRDSQTTPRVYAPPNKHEIVGSGHQHVLFPLRVELQENLRAARPRTMSNKTESRRLCDQTLAEFMRFLLIGLPASPPYTRQWRVHQGLGLSTSREIIIAIHDVVHHHVLGKLIGCR